MTDIEGRMTGTQRRYLEKGELCWVILLCCCNKARSPNTIHLFPNIFFVSLSFFLQCLSFRAKRGICFQPPPRPHLRPITTNDESAGTRLKPESQSKARSP